jgi:cytochrome c-type biogenesis protein
MNPFLAYIMGFTFSFAWTPCVGPVLASVLILASNARNVFTGNLLVALYALGFIIPFLILGFFTTETLNFLRKEEIWLSIP